MSVETIKVQIIKKAWAEPAFKASLLADPKNALLTAFGIEVPEDVELKVVAETTELFYLVIPPSPEEAGDGASDSNIVWN